MKFHLCFTPRSASTALVALLGLAATSAMAYDKTTTEKYVLVYKAEVGQTKRIRDTATLTLTPPGSPAKVPLELKSTDKVTFTKVDAASGDVTYDDLVETQEAIFAGQKAPDDGKRDTKTITMHKGGLLASYKSSDNDKDDIAFGARLYNATTVVFSDKAVGAGDKWSVDIKGDAAIGSRDGHADFELVSEQKTSGVDTVTVKMTYTETGTNAITGKGTFLIEKISGDPLSYDYDVENVPIGGAVAGGKLHEDRTEGGPLAASKNDPSKKVEKEKTIDDVIKDGFEKLPGIVTLYRKKDAGRETIYAELRENQLNQLMMLQATASTGTGVQVIAGDPIDDLLFKFTRSQDDKILLTVPNYNFRTTPGTPMAKAVRRSFADAFLQAFKIEAKQPDRKSILIDVSDLFKSDLSQVSQKFAGGAGPFGGGGGGFGMDREKTYIQSIKNFPENLVVSTQYNFARGAANGPGAETLADGRSAPIVVSYNLFALPVDENYKPTNGFKPRLADPRVGYFTTEYIDFSDDSKDDLTTRLILHWDVRKKDPTAAMSEPVKPITFWVDNAIPVEYRGVVRDSVLEWNTAFEKIGIKNAIVVNQMPDNADWDHADMRYNVVRWVVTPDGAPRNGVAIALFRANPLTGQIMNASISVDASWTRYPKLQKRSLIDPAKSFEKGAGEDVEAMLAGKTTLPLQLQRAMTSGDPRFCQIGEGLQEQAQMGWDAISLLAAPGISPLIGEKEYTDQLLKETIAHEMGHILGLRHNFIASTEFSLEELKNAKTVKENGISASLMDYNAFNISALRQKNVDFYSQTIGTYDKWAIEYGYTPLDNANAELEATRLKQIASQSNLPGHAYQSDEMVMAGFDPKIQQYDMTSDPLAYWQKMMDLSRYLLVNLDKRKPLNGESYWEFTKAFNSLLNNYARAAGSASRYIGGLNANRNHKGDPDQKPTLLPIEAAKQKQALGMLNTYIFSPSALSFPEKYYLQLTSDPNGFTPFGADFPIGDQLSGIQKTALRRIFSPTVLTRVANNEFKRGGDGNKTLTLPYLFSSVSTNVWADLGNKNLPNLRRQLQRTYVDLMIDMATKPGSPEDARMLAWDQLRTLKGRLETTQKATGYDDYTRIHVADSLNKVNRALSAGMVLNAQSGGGAPMNLLQLLMGGEGQTTNAKP